MNPPPKILDAEITPSHLKVRLDTGIMVLMPLEHVPTLLLATEKERQDMEVFDRSLHWESLDCDLSVEGLLNGAKEMPSLARNAEVNAVNQSTQRRIIPKDNYMVASDFGIAENIHYVSPRSRCFTPFGWGGLLCACAKCAFRFKTQNGLLKNIEQK